MRSVKICWNGSIKIYDIDGASIISIPEGIKEKDGEVKSEEQINPVFQFANRDWLKGSFVADLGICDANQAAQIISCCHCS